GGLDALRLLVRQAARTDHLDELLQRGDVDREPVRRRAVGEPDAAPTRAGIVLLDRLVRRVRLPQLDERLFGVHVGAVLGEDRQDQLRGWVPAALPGVVPVQLDQGIEGEADQARSRAIEALAPDQVRVRLASGALLRRLPASGRLGRLPRRQGHPARVRPAESSRARRRPHRSMGATPAAIASSSVCGRSLTPTEMAPTAQSAASPSGSTPPPIATHGTPAACATLATPSAVLPNAVWASMR